MGGSAQHGAATKSWAGKQPATAQAEALSRQHVEMAPLDPHNAKLLDQVHPREWASPTPQPLYNMVVVGAGAGGLVTAAQAAKRGAKVALIERGMMGGDCLNVGCVPSKALLACAKRLAHVHGAEEFGVRGTVGSAAWLDFPVVMERMRRIRADIAAADSVERFTGPELGIDIFFGNAAFTGPSSVTVNGETLQFKKACIATGGRAAVPPVPGLATVPYRTNATIFNLTMLPARLAIIGAGPIGCELAQCFALFGSEVHVYDLAPAPLVREDQDAAKIVIAALERDGVAFHCSTDLASVAPSKGGKSGVDLSFRSGATESFDEILVCAGRTPNTENLGLAVAGVGLTKEGRILINDSLQTSNPDVYAVGDVCMSTQFTHVAGESAQLVVRNALCADTRSWSELAIPWATYTHPEIAHVGKYASELEAAGMTEGKADAPNSFSTFTMPIGGYDRPKCDGEKEGFVRIHVGAKGTILGATIVGAQAGELITTFTLAIQSAGGIGAVEIAKSIVPYPTVAEAVKYCCNQYNIQTWGGWPGLKATWTPVLVGALQPGASDTAGTPSTVVAGAAALPTAAGENQVKRSPAAMVSVPSICAGFFAGGACVAAVAFLRAAKL